MRKEDGIQLEPIGGLTPNALNTSTALSITGREDSISRTTTKDEQAPVVPKEGFESYPDGGTP